ncbi:hypothetical protein BDF21DRAFT_405182 [Thamnidium elegans]|nr:hypothetical protein BDF21DRAFT_405182 [Thamnidium elegans]
MQNDHMDCIGLLKCLLNAANLSLLRRYMYLAAITSSAARSLRFDPVVAIEMVLDFVLLVFFFTNVTCTIINTWFRWRFASKIAVLGQKNWNTNVIAFNSVDRGYTALLSNCRSRFSNSTCILVLKK